MKSTVIVLTLALSCASVFAQSFNEQFTQYKQWFNDVSAQVQRDEIKRSEAAAQGATRLNQITTTEAWQRRVVSNHLLFMSRVEASALEFEAGKISKEQFRSAYNMHGAMLKDDLAKLEQDERDRQERQRAEFEAANSRQQAERAARAQQDSNDFMNGLMLLNAARPRVIQPSPLIAPSINCTSRQVFNQVQTTCN